MLVYVTNSEGLGSGALLAMSAAVPVIASNVGGLPRSDPPRRKRAAGGERRGRHRGAPFDELLDDPEQARRIGDAARQTVIERFTVDHMVAVPWKSTARYSRDAIYLQHARQDAVAGPA